MAQKTNMFGVQRVLFSLVLAKYYKNDKSYKHTESIRPAKDFKCKIALGLGLLLELPKM